MEGYDEYGPFFAEPQRGEVLRTRPGCYSAEHVLAPGYCAPCAASHRPVLVDRDGRVTPGRQDERVRVVEPPGVGQLGGVARAAAERLWWLVAPLVAVWAYRSLTGFSFVGDARFLIVENRYLREPGRALDQLLHNYFWSSSGNAVPYWRPLTKLSWYLELDLFGPWAGGFLLVQLGWFVSGIIALQLLARRLGMSRVWAGLAGVVFALHPVAIAPVSMVMARSDVVAASASIVAVLAWLRWRDGAGRRWAWLHGAAVVVALASKESSVVVPAVLAVWTWLERDGLSVRQRLVHLGPSVALAAGYLVARRALLERDLAGLGATELVFDPLRIAASLGRYLFNTFPFALHSTVRDVAPAEAASTRELLRASVALAVVVALCVYARRRKLAWLLGLVVWMLLALMPVVLTADIAVPTAHAKYPMADRWLFHALPPALLLWLEVLRRLGARAVERLRLHAPTASRRLSWLAATAAVAWAALLLVRARSDRAEFADELGMLNNEDRLFYWAVPEAYRTQADHCAFLERKVVRALLGRDDAAVVERARAATERCGDAPRLMLYRLLALVRLERYDEALALAGQLVERPPTDRRGHAQLTEAYGIALAARGRCEEAAGWFGRAAGFGITSCRHHLLLGECLRGSGAVIAAARSLERAFACGGRRDPSLLLAGATWLATAGQSAAARELLVRAEQHRLTPDQSQQAAWLHRTLR